MKTNILAVVYLASIITITYSTIVYPIRLPLVPIITERYEVNENPEYSFAYQVNDEGTGDIKTQTESRKGHIVLGEYSLVQPDGIKRTVEYKADQHTGFNAVVTNDKPSSNIANFIIDDAERRRVSERINVADFQRQPFFNSDSQRDISNVYRKNDEQPVLFDSFYRNTENFQNNNEKNGKGVDLTRTMNQHENNVQSSNKLPTDSFNQTNDNREIWTDTQSKDLETQRVSQSVTDNDRRQPVSVQSIPLARSFVLQTTRQTKPWTSLIIH